MAERKPGKPGEFINRQSELAFKIGALIDRALNMPNTSESLQVLEREYLGNSEIDIDDLAKCNDLEFYSKTDVDDLPFVIFATTVHQMHMMNPQYTFHEILNLLKDEGERYSMGSNKRFRHTYTQ